MPDMSDWEYKKDMYMQLILWFKQINIFAFKEEKKILWQKLVAWC